MDIDNPVELIPSTPTQPLNEGIFKTEEKRPLVVSIDDAHPFDLEAYISGYSGTHTNLRAVKSIVISELNSIR